MELAGRFLRLDVEISLTIRQKSFTCVAFKICYLCELCSSFEIRNENTIYSSLEYYYPTIFSKKQKWGTEFRNGIRAECTNDRKWPISTQFYRSTDNMKNVIKTSAVPKLK